MKHVRHFYSTRKKTEQNGQSQQWYSISNYHSETLIAHRQGQLVLSLHHPLAQNRKANLQLRFARESRLWTRCPVGAAAVCKTTSAAVRGSDLADAALPAPRPRPRPRAARPRALALPAADSPRAAKLQFMGSSLCFCRRAIKFGYWLEASNAM